MGLPMDSQRSKLFVDTYGEDIGRDLEPTVVQGSRLINITASCMRVIRLQSALGISLFDQANPIDMESG